MSKQKQKKKKIFSIYIYVERFEIIETTGGECELKWCLDP